MASGDITLRQAIEHAVKTEQRGAAYYQRMAKTFADNQAVADVFTQLAKDEEEHGSEFSQLLSQVPGGEETDSEALQMVQAAGLTGELDADNLDKPEDITSPKDALLKALSFERSTLFYYQSLKEALGDSPQLQALISAEKSHVLVLMKVLVTDADFRGLGDRW
jgi:rubrerythrin